jgi:hypothetical protein
MKDNEVYKIVKNEFLKGTHEQNEDRKNPKINFTLSAKRTKINRTFKEEMGGKYETATSHLD